jgi:succinoglycan biosynthesis protein ExoA
VDRNLPSVSIIVPAPPDMGEVKAEQAARALDYPADRVEIILARGRQPSVQRNTALRAAKGDLIYFLDDDALPDRGNLRRAVAHFTDPAVKMVGGPNLCPPEAPELEQVFALVLSSWLAFGPSRARYAKVGVVRATSEKELILCNQLARRETLLELGGFDEKLYPNEENALMDEIQKRGGRLLYDPEVFVHRRPRRTLKSFCRMLRTYGRGRAEQVRVKPTLGSLPNFVPPMFCVYLVLLLAGGLFCAFAGGWHSTWAAVVLAPLACYVLIVLAQTVVLMWQGGVVRGLLAAPLLVLAHILYGLGFWRGLFTSLNKPASPVAAEVRLETISP